MRAQIESQVIVYVLAVIIMAMVLIFGYQAIHNLTEQGRLIQLKMCKDDLRTGIGSIASNYGSSKALNNIRCPAEFTKVCFVNLDHPYTETGDNDVMDYIGSIDENDYPIIKDRVSGMVEDNFERMNVFLCPPCTEQFYVGKIALLAQNGDNTMFKCFTPTSGGALKLTVGGLGDGTSIS
jgi:hypothetical protein